MTSLTAEFLIYATSFPWPSPLTLLLPENSGNKVVSSDSLPLIILRDLPKHIPPYPKLPKVDARKAKTKLIIKKNLRNRKSLNILKSIKRTKHFK